MPVMTPWGYRVEADALPPLITPEQLADATGGRFGPATPGAAAALAGASAVIRNACGWHVSPPLPCSCRTQGPGRVLSLPALLIDDPDSVTEEGRELAAGEFEWAENGTLRRCCWREWPRALGSVEVRYTAGIPADVAPDLVTVAAQVAANSLAAPAGVRSEQAGDVSISYNQTASGVSGGIRLLDSDLALLAPYRLRGTWS